MQKFNVNPSLREWNIHHLICPPSPDLHSDVSNGYGAWLSNWWKNLACLLLLEHKVAMLQHLVLSFWFSLTNYEKIITLNVVTEYGLQMSTCCFQDKILNCKRSHHSFVFKIIRLVSTVFGLIRRLICL